MAPSQQDQFRRFFAELVTVAGISQAELARALNVPKSNVSNWLAGVNEPRPATVFALEGALGVAPGTLSRLLGYLPTEAAVPPPPGVEAAIKADRHISDGFRRGLLLLYREAVATSGRGDGDPA